MCECVSEAEKTDVYASTCIPGQRVCVGTTKIDIAPCIGVVLLILSSIDTMIVLERHAAHLVHHLPRQEQHG